MRRTCTSLAKTPFNKSVAPRYDIWYQKYEPHVHMRRMAKMVGTGFYVPPDWYTHFRMFPPIQDNFQQEATLNPYNDAEPTQSDMSDKKDAARQALRDELAKGSRSLASAGKRYYNLFWVQKPLDDMERKYYQLQRKGVSHDVAVKRVLAEYYESLAVKKRVQLIQAEEAKLSGNFITMKEAMTVLQVLSQVQEEQLAPHQYAQLAHRTEQATASGSLREASVEQKTRVIHPSVEEEEANTAKLAAAAAEGTDEAEALKAAAEAAVKKAEEAAKKAAAQRPEEGSAESLIFMLNEENNMGANTQSTSELVADPKAPEGDSIPQLKEKATDSTGDAGWYDGFDIMMDPLSPSSKPE